MDFYNSTEYGNQDSYLIQGLTSPSEQVGAMYNEGTPEFVVDQGLYYPSGASYGYYCTGFEAPGNWEDHHRIFGVDGPDIQYAGAQSENLPYVYYTPSYGFAQSAYNPYVPGSVMGVDSPVLGSQQYYSVPLYQNPSLPNYVPFTVQPDVMPNISPDSWLDTGRSVSNKPDGRGLKPSVASGSVAYHKNPPKTVSNQTNSTTRVPEAPKGSTGPTKQQVMLGSISSGSVPSHLIEGRILAGSSQPIDNVRNGSLVTHRTPKVAVPVSDCISNFGSNTQGTFAGDKLQSKIPAGGALNDLRSNPDALGEQNRGPRINRSKTQLVVKAYTTKAGDCDEQGNIIINTDLYNKDDFPVDYANAKFFVIKSYSEDDVHKSIKYNFWSSTPHGNKKLNSAYEDAQKLTAGDSRGCPIFLFFSVNASGQFCGVAEMTGPVDFQMDMDFWQQDKWSGSFPVKWHFIKDVPNIYFRHIILENNENKPVTNSRDTQEIMFDQGQEMLRIFKNHPLKTSVFDDFMYYENRQRIMQEQKAKLLIKRLETPFFVPAVEPPRKISCAVDPPSIENWDNTKDNYLKETKADTFDSEQVSSACDVNSATRVNEKVEQVSSESKDDISTIKIGSLTINPRQTGPKPVDASATDGKAAEIVTVGSVPVKVNGSGGSSGFLTVGTIPLDPKALRLDKRDAAK